MQNEYNRRKAIKYAEKWAYLRNEKYYNFDEIGGDCTNFVSQCIYQGSNVMNYKKEFGWYYIDANNKSPSWTGVEFLHNFLVNNKTIGPYGKIIKRNEAKIGDVIQLSFDGKKFQHTLIIVDIEEKLLGRKIKVASHTLDTFRKRYKRV